MQDRSLSSSPQIIPREKLDFDLDGDIPQYWMDNDPFKTRFFDALSTLFPIGEKFFISCVRDYKDQITDPKLLADIKDFTRQEAQHGMLHTQYNNRLHRQGVNVPEILRKQEQRLFGFLRKRTRKAFTLGITAASEHITAIMADCFVERPQIFEHADERVRALFMWHAMEEMEHKSVAFDVLTRVARANYWTRSVSMLVVTVLFPYHVFKIMAHMLEVDGFSRTERMKLWAKGLWWLYKPGGIFMPMVGKHFAYFKPGFHPWQDPAVASYEPWKHLLRELGDPIAAANTLQTRMLQGELQHA